MPADFGRAEGQPRNPTAHRPSGSAVRVQGRDARSDLRREWRVRLLSTITQVQDRRSICSTTTTTSGKIYERRRQDRRRSRAHLLPEVRSSRRRRYQLMHYDGADNDVPIVDNVVGLEFEYFGDPQPPMSLPGSRSATSGQWTTPMDRSRRAWAPNGTTAVWRERRFTGAGGLQAPRARTRAASRRRRWSSRRSS